MALLIYVVIVARGNDVHPYYQLPFVIPGAVMMGKVYARHFTLTRPIETKGIVLAVTFVGLLILGTWRMLAFTSKENASGSAEYELAQAIQSRTLPQDRLIVIDRRDPTVLYLAHRKGWHAFPDQVNNGFFRDKNHIGAAYVAGVFEYFDNAQRSGLEQILGQQNVVWRTKDSFLVRIYSAAGL